MNSSSPSTQTLSSVNESTNRHRTKMRDTNKLTSESSSLNFKQALAFRSHLRQESAIETAGSDSGRGSLNSTDTCMHLQKKTK